MFQNFGEYLDSWRDAQKMLKLLGQLPPRAYGEALEKRRKRKKNTGKKR